METSVTTDGLKGVIAARTTLTDIDGQAGRFLISGYPVEEIAPRAQFEELVFLLWNGHLPTQEELVIFQNLLASKVGLPAAVGPILEGAAERGLPVLDALRAAIDCAELHSPDGREAGEQLLALSPAIVAAYWRMLSGGSPVASDPTLSLCENYLLMLSGRQPSPAMSRALNTYWNCMIDHGLNASTFTARVIISTRSDLKSAIVGALGALKGPLHGGAPGPALEMLRDIRDVSRAEAYLRAILDRGERLMGFGHRVYKTRDPRAEMLSLAAQALTEQTSDEDIYELELTRKL